MYADFLKARTKVIRKCDRLAPVAHFNSAQCPCAVLKAACTVQVRHEPHWAGNGLLPWVEVQAAIQEWALASMPAHCRADGDSEGQVKSIVIHPPGPSSQRWWVLHGLALAFLNAGQAIATKKPLTWPGLAYWGSSFACFMA